MVCGVSPSPASNGTSMVDVSCANSVCQALTAAGSRSAEDPLLRLGEGVRRIAALGEQMVAVAGNLRGFGQLGRSLLR